MERAARLLVMGLVTVSVAVSVGSATATSPTVYDLYASYPDIQQVQSGYFLNGTTVTESSGSLDPVQAVLWFALGRYGFFKQFSSEPYDQCNWDLLRWLPGPHGSLVYLATDNACGTTDNSVVFRPGVTFMPKTWTVGQTWVEKGTSSVSYDVGGAAVCVGRDQWRSQMLGVVQLPDGEQAVHTQTNEDQTLVPIPGSPYSDACPSSAATDWSWQENFYVGSTLEVEALDGANTGDAPGLAASVGGNEATLKATGYPEWNSQFTSWEPLPAPTTSTATGTDQPSDGGSDQASPASDQAYGTQTDDDQTDGTP